MTPEQLRKLDARLAEVVMGWRYWTRYGFWWFGPADEPDRDEFGGDPPMIAVSREEAIQNFTDAAKAGTAEKFEICPHYSTNPADSKALREKLAADGWSWALSRAATLHPAFQFEIYSGANAWSGYAETDEEAVALCAAKAYAINVEEIANAEV